MDLRETVEHNYCEDQRDYGSRRQRRRTGLAVSPHVPVPVDDQPGFEGFELLKPTDERNTWLVITRWADDESFQAWVSSPAFGHGHRREADPSGPPAAPHVGMSSELWSYEIAGGSSL
jgi:heme-degrading monooxygenase HmoA